LFSSETPIVRWPAAVSLFHDRTKHTNAGTPNYMAPELLDCRPFNKSVDVYAFGIVLYEVMQTLIFCTCHSGWCHMIVAIVIKYCERMRAIRSYISSFGSLLP
jgi:serine/threonine protein kinase